jgi:hypothetical protein
MVRQGLTDRLVGLPAERIPGIVPVQGAGYVDAERTIALWRDVYTAHRTLLRRGHWVDIASDGIPRHYAGAGYLASEMLARRGDEQAAAEAMATVRRIMEIVGEN